MATNNSDMTKFNLAGFYGALKTNSLLYKNQFYVEFSAPTDFFANFVNKEIFGTGSSPEKLGFFIQSSKVPGFTMTNGKTTFMGTELRTPGFIKYDHKWSCNVLLTEDLSIYKFFRSWMTKLSSLSKSGGGDKKLTNTQIKIYILDETGKKSNNCVVLEGVWCKSVGDISLEYKDGGGDPVKNFPIEFAYQYNFIDGTEGTSNKG